MMNNLHYTKKELFNIIAGSAIFGIGVNLFVSAAGLYSSGILGGAQVIRTLLVKVIGEQAFDIASILYFLINVPIFIIAYRSLSPKFFFASLLSVAIQSLAISICPTPETPILSDTLANCVIGGVISAYGIGMILSIGASGGGLDVIGLIVTLKNKDFSVGKLSLLINVIIYTCCALLFDLQTAIYSIIYAVIYAACIDKFHTLNIETSLMIFTRNKEVKKQIMSKYVRGVTYWNGKGAYTDHDMEILVTVVSKSEVRAVEKTIREIDPDAFVIVTSGLDVQGGYEKRLIIH